MRRRPEDVVQKQVKHIYTLVGCEMYDLSQGYRPDPGGTRQTPGLPDLYGFLPLASPGTPALFWHEVKTEKGLAEHHKLLEVPAARVKPSQAKNWNRAVAQRQFREHCIARAIPYAIGGVEAAKDLLVRVGLAHRDSHGVVILKPAPRLR